MTPTETKWLRVNRELTCPVCGKSDWCLVAADGSAAICPRTESQKRCGDAGYLHRLTDTQRRREPRRVVLPIRTAPPDLTALATQFQHAATMERLTAFAEELRVTVACLNAYGAGWAASYPAWTFPMTNPTTRKVTGIRLRRLDGIKFSVKSGRESLFLPNSLSTDDVMLITEGTTDAIAAHSIGFLNTVGRPSCTGGTAHIVALMRARKPGRVVIVRDNDEPGVRGAEALARVLVLYCRDVRVISPPEANKDVRDWIGTGATREDVEQLISAAAPRRLEISTGGIDVNATDSGALEVTADREGKKHKVTIKLDGNAVFVDKLDLSSASAREKFLDVITSKYPGIDRDTLDSRLMAFAATDATDAPTQGAERASDPLAGTPQDISDEANAILNSPELIGRVCDDVAALGVAGERELVATVYLIGVSRLLPRPLAGIIRGSSSSGKSYTVEKVASLFPPEEIIHATQMTPQALFHMKPGSLQHKWVVAGERSRLEDDERAEATRALREMLASGRLSKLMPLKIGNEIETQAIEQEGPIAFTETTTLTNIFEEDANRCLLLQTDETPAQTKRIICALAERQVGESEDTNSIIRVHHTLQRRLPRFAVRVPWSDRLAAEFNCERVEVRRAFPQLLALVQASALLHYRQRGIGKDSAILADARDYHLARRLIVKPFAQSLGGGLTESALAFLKKLPPHDEFTSKGIAKQLKVSKSSAASWLSDLHDAGAVAITEQGRGRLATKWKLTGKSPDSGEDLLPSVENLFSEFAKRMDATQKR
ncbi:MAG: toprim domain-containing protein [Planctomycetia bacterium]|nr:toprim domain-containing protein [Planctomycetia bacterium]